MKKLGILGAMLALCVAIGFAGLPDVGAHLASNSAQAVHKSTANITVSSHAHAVHKKAANVTRAYLVSSHAHAVHKSTANATRAYLVSSRALVVHKSTDETARPNLASTRAHEVHKKVSDPTRSPSDAKNGNVKLQTITKFIHIRTCYPGPDWKHKNPCKKHHPCHGKKCHHKHPCKCHEHKDHHKYPCKCHKHKDHHGKRGLNAGFDTVTTAPVTLQPPTPVDSTYTTYPTTVAVLPLPEGKFVVNAIIPIAFQTSHGQVRCSFNILNGHTDGTPQAATAIATAPTSGESVNGYQTLPLTDSVTIDAKNGTVQVVCTLETNSSDIPTATAQAGTSITADQKSKLKFIPQPLG
ncbi:MAG TPA: hypothetical protein VL485_06415 [Ktedonobacteraceae bacterium]|nr:hypothetical protein [Ktedonobacteraceae bacterium]